MICLIFISNIVVEMGMYLVWVRASLPKVFTLGFKFLAEGVDKYLVFVLQTFRSSTVM